MGQRPGHRQTGDRCRRDLLDHAIVLNKRHLNRLLRDYVSYYHADRTHDSLEKDTPAMRPFLSKPGNPLAWFHSHASADCIIDTTGSRLLKKVPFLMPDLSRSLMDQFLMLRLKSEHASMRTDYPTLFGNSISR
jgi:hypothetical protein